MQKALKETPFLPYQTKIKSIKDETNDVKTYTMGFMDDEMHHHYNYKPGQFNMLSIAGLGECAVSLSSTPNGEGEFTHTVRSVGRVTNKLSTLESGSIIGIRGPYGRPWPIDELVGKNVIIVAGGIGLAPLRPVVLNIINNRNMYKKVELLYGVKMADQFLFTDEYQEWQKNNVDVNLTVDMGSTNEWPYHTGVVTTLFDKLKSRPANTVALLCGPDVMMQFCTLELLRSGFSDNQIFLSLERRMDCAVRMCGHCMLGPKFVCQDGPVFNYSEIKGLFGYVA